jgi:glutamate synthase (ferredoxin)
VTNPPIDCIREELVTSAATTIGSERNLLKPKPMSCNLLELHSPILTNEQFAKLKYIKEAGFKSVTLPILFKAAEG